MALADLVKILIYETAHRPHNETKGWFDLRRLVQA